MKRSFTTLAAAALVLVFATAAVANHRDESIASLVKQLGCAATVQTYDDVSPVRSAFSPLNNTLYIGTEDDPTLPVEVADMIVLHEIGHCLQLQDGTVWTGDTLTLELDADRRSVDLACSIGRDGRSLQFRLWKWVNEKFGYVGDHSHGTIAERIAQADNATMCSPRHTEPQA
jgi:hypothetical protein